MKGFNFQVSNVIMFDCSFPLFILYESMFPLEHFEKNSYNWKHLATCHVIIVHYPLSVSQMDSPNGTLLHKSEAEVPFGTEINFHQSESTLVDVHGSQSGDSRAAHHQTLRGTIYRSIRVVVFSNRFNLLMPFGPLAILVHNLTGHNVSFNSCNS